MNLNTFEPLSVDGFLNNTQYYEKTNIKEQERLSEAKTDPFIIAMKYVMSDMTLRPEQSLKAQNSILAVLLHYSDLKRSTGSSKPTRDNIEAAEKGLPMFIRELNDRYTDKYGAWGEI
jgi:hypothetical protein